ncbi:MAG: Spy/CpxP family protein refolding chaperone [Alphaproteobacteria bacterium]|nr:Spy/CpxP family protein refolding chaperone [Alphaproteobacteria bacterium]
MMDQGGMMMHGRGMGAMHMFDRIEGKIAFLRAELKIADAQAPAWNALADALRASAKRIADARAATTPAATGGSPPTLTIPERLDRHERRLAAHLESVRAIKAALAPLYAALSDEQKKTAEELLRPHMGMAARGGPNR